MNSNLRHIVGQVRDGAEAISTAASQIAAGNQYLFARTEEQASSLEQTACSMEELTSTIKNTEIIPVRQRRYHTKPLMRPKTAVK